MHADRDFLTFIKGMLKGKRLILFLFAAALILALIIVPRLGSDTDEGAEESETEKRISELCSSVDGVGKCRVMVTYESSGARNEEPKVYSVAVICEGADNVTVRARVTELVTSLYGIGSNRVSVIKLKK